MRLKDALGRYGERMAIRYLSDAGLAVIEKNWRCSRGEIDIVARDGATLVFCEVKTRSSTAFGDPAEAIGRTKSSRLRLLGVCWLAEHPGHWDEVRFDVVSVLRAQRGPVQVRHLRGAL